MDLNKKILVEILRTGITSVTCGGLEFRKCGRGGHALREESGRGGAACAFPTGMLKCRGEVRALE